MRISRKQMMLLAAAVIMLALFYQWSLADHRAYVRISPIRRGELIASVTAVGIIKPVKEREIKAQVEGNIGTVLVEEGGKVIEGEELITINSLNGKVVVKSPISGTVLLRPKTTEIGEDVKPGQLLLAIGNLDQLEIEANINETESKNIREGQKTIISNDAYLEKKLLGKISSVSPQVREIEGATKVPIKIEVITPSSLKPGNRVDIEVITAYKKKAFFVPLEAVIFRANKKIIFLIEEGKVIERAVATGISNINYIEILPDHKTGKISQVVVSNNLLLKEGESVRYK